MAVAVVKRVPTTNSRLHPEITHSVGVRQEINGFVDNRGQK